MSIGIGIIGLGWISQKIHLPFFTNNSDIDFVGVFDIDDFKVNEVKKNFKINQVFNTYDSLIKCKKINIVVIATPNHLHQTQINEAIINNKYVFSEKPLCINGLELENLKALESHLGNLFPLLPSRYTQEVNKVKELIGTIGDIYKVKGTWNRGNGIPTSSWFTNKNKSGGGVLIDLGSHIIDVIFYLLDFPDILNSNSFLSNNFLNQNEKKANWHESNTDKKNTRISDSVEDNAQVFLKSRDMSIYIDLSWASVRKYDESTFEIHGTKGSIIMKTLFGFSRNRYLDNSTIVYEVDQKEEIVIQMKNNNPSSYYFEMLENNLAKVKRKESNIDYVKNAFKTIDIIDRLYTNQNLGINEEVYYV
ncbi:Gfo/Idh/MocA family oxidoreductase [Cytobacillus kochii]|uniref:Gfo/Idh/MocA family protein n=1 Tax=Cytobacillus kochii TaxID=859143 RepID=UPI001CD6DFC2|nr:Gfo/Idh/MocA family oxidoreductase [Cytobacillus kochii]MCA1028621.1 Gfo/Idh/MocA family oxidoreductase [Cytobacillus kochii]